METGKQIVDKITSVKGGDFGDERKQRNYATLSGGAVGGMIGIYYGYSKKQNVVAMAIGGFLIGALFARLMVKV